MHSYGLLTCEWLILYLVKKKVGLFVQLKNLEKCGKI